MNSKTSTALVITSALAGGAAQGAIVYTNFNSQALSVAAQNLYLQFTVNGNSANGQYTILYEDGNNQKPEVRGDGVNTFVLARTWQDTTAEYSNYRTYGGLPLTYGGVMVTNNMIDVNPAKQFNGITNLTVQANGYFNDRPFNTDADTGGNDHFNYLGDWGQIATNTGYVGLMMVGGGVTNYGWAHFTWYDPTTTYQPNPVVFSVILIDGAYQTTPNVGILTGDGTPGVPVMSGVNLTTASTTNYTGACIGLAANALSASVSGATNFQWQAGTNGVYVNLPNGAGISGSTTPNLVISPAALNTPTNYILIASDSSGSTTSSPPVSLTMISAGAIPTNSDGWYNAFQGQTDFTYAGGRNNVSYHASNGTTYWLFAQMAEGTMNPADNSFSAINPNLVPDKILMESGGYRVPADLTFSTADSVFENPNDYYTPQNMFEANNSIYVVLQRQNSAYYDREGADMARYAEGPGGMLQFGGWVFTPTSGDTAVGTTSPTNTSIIQWTDGTVVQNGYVYFFGDATTLPGNTAATYVARVPTNNLANTDAGAWTYWDGVTWDPQITNAAIVISNQVDYVGLYQSNWVAVFKYIGLYGDQSYAFTAAQPQGPYTMQYLFTDPNNDIDGIGLTNNPETAAADYYYTANPTFHAEDSTSSNVLFSIDWWDANSYTYNSLDAEIYKPRFYSVTLTNLVTITNIPPPGPPGITGLYASSILALNPVLFYPLNEVTNAASGTAIAYDYSTNAENGTYGISVLNGYNGIAGPTPALGFDGFSSTNTAAQFTNGIANYAGEVQLPATLPIATNALTMTAWINPAQIVQPQYAGIFMSDQAGTTNVNGICYGKYNYTTNAGIVSTQQCIAYSWNNANTAVTSGLFPSSNQWSMVAVAVNGSQSNVVLYLFTTNGMSLYNEKNISGKPLLTAIFTGQNAIGNFPSDTTGSRGFCGAIADVAVFNGFLSSNQLITLYSEAQAMPPTITLQPQPETLFTNQTVLTNQTANFIAAASGLTPLSYQWQFSSGGAYANVNNGANISGAQSNALTITGVGSGNVGNYILVVTNAAGVVTSSVAPLTLISAPSGSSYESTIASTPGLVAFYELNELVNPALSNVVAYDYVGGNYGTYGIAVSNGFTGVAGPRPANGFPGFSVTNTAALFTNGVTNYESSVALPALSLNTNTVTITAWIYPIGAMQPTYAGIVMYRGGSTNTAGFDYGASYAPAGQATNVYLNYTWNSKVTAVDIHSGLLPPSNQWSFVSLVIAPTNVTIWLMNTNGINSFVSNAYTNPVQSFGVPMTIGNDDVLGATGSRGFNGVIDEVGIFNTALTQSQLTAMYNAAAGSATLPTISLSQSSGAVILTWSGSTLQQSTNLNTGWTVVPGAASPMTLGTSTNSQMYFRTIK